MFGNRVTRKCHNVKILLKDMTRHLAAAMRSSSSSIYFLFSIIIEQLLNMCLTNHFAYGQEALMSFFLAGKGVGVGLSLAMNKNDVVHEF